MRIGHGHRVLRHVLQARVEELAFHAGARLHHAVPVAAQPRLVDLARRLEAVFGGEALPLDREWAVALEVAERAVVAQHVESIARALPRASGLVATVPAVTDAGPQDLAPLLGRHRPRERQQLIVGEIARCVEHRCRDLQLTVRIMVNQLDFFPRLGLDVFEHPRGERFDAFVVRLPVRRPRHAALRDVDALQELRDHLAQFDQHEVADLAHLGERMHRQAHQQLFVGLPGGVDPQVRPRARGQQHAQRVARLGQHRLAIHEVGVALLLREPFLEVGLHRLVHAAVGGEHLVEERDVAIGERRAGEFGRHGGPPRAAGPVVVAHVARRLLQVGGQASPLQRLGQQLRGLLTRQVHAAQLGHRVVAVLDEHVLVEASGAFTADGGRRRGPQRRGLFRELIEEQAPERLRGARIPGEQRTLHRFGQVHQGEDGPFEVREMPFERGALVR